MKTLVNRQTRKSVPKFIDAIKNKRRQADSRTMLKLMKEVTSKEPKIWGVGIVGYGKYKYARKNGEEYEWFTTGFSPGSAHMTIYVMYDINTEQELLKKLGPHKTGKGCLYIKKLEDVDLEVLKKIVAKSDRWGSSS